MLGKPIKLIEWLYNQDKEKYYEVKEYIEKRNNKQNSKYWKLLSELAMKLNISIEEAHFEILKNYSKRIQILIPEEEQISGIEYYEKKSTIQTENGKRFSVYYVFTPSHELNRKEFAYLLNGLCEECRQQDIETLSPGELAELKAIMEGNK